MMLLDGVIESGLTQLNGSHTDPEAQAEQPGHDRTHLLRTGRGGVKAKDIMFSIYDLTPQHTQTHTNISRVMSKVKKKNNNFNILNKHSGL